MITQISNRVKNSIMGLTKACLPVGREFIKVVIIVAIAVPIINLVAATLSGSARQTLRPAATPNRRSM